MLLRLRNTILPLYKNKAFVFNSFNYLNSFNYQTNYLSLKYTSNSSFAAAKLVRSPASTERSASFRRCCIKGLL